MYKRLRLLFVFTVVVSSSLFVIFYNQWTSYHFTPSPNHSKTGYAKENPPEGDPPTSPIIVTHDSKQEKRKAVVIVASYRTGSSFIAEMFNQHPDVFYLFEPLYFDNRNINAQVIEDLLLCKMTTLRRELYKAWVGSRPKGGARKSSNPKHYRFRQCLYQGVCFRVRSKSLCTPDVCRGKKVGKCDRCPGLKLQEMERKCREAKVRVIKVIRVYDLIQLQQACANVNIELRILYLVRDPRPMALSRQVLKKEADISSLVQGTCQDNVKNIRYFSSVWLQGIFTLIRYEEAVEDPEVFLHDLYNFINFEDFYVHDDVIKWLRHSTNSIDKNLFGTNRITKDQDRKWREGISFDDVMRIQQTCDEMMTSYGYKKIESKEELRNIKIPLLEQPVTLT